jgi:hypothetical protein
LSYSRREDRRDGDVNGISMHASIARVTNAQFEDSLCPNAYKMKQAAWMDAPVLRELKFI